MSIPISEITNLQTTLDAKALSSLDTALADTQYTGVTRALGVSGTVAVGDWCMLIDSSGTALWGIVDTSDVAKRCLGVCVGSSGSNRTVLLSGRFRHDTVFSALTTTGVTVFRHVDTDGSFQVTTPSGTNKALQVYGIVDSAKTVLVNPSMDVFTIT